MVVHDLFELLRSTGALLEGHFELTSGRHSRRFLQLSQVMQYPETAAALCSALAGKFSDLSIDTVAGPAMGGVILAYEVARQMGKRAIYVEKEKGAMALRRGFAVREGEKILVVEDVVSTGGSVRNAIQTLEEFGAEIVAVGALVDRSAGAVRFGVPFRTLWSIEVPSYAPDECPLCEVGLPVYKPKLGTSEPPVFRELAPAHISGTSCRQPTD